MLLGDAHVAACGLQSKGCGPSMHPGDVVDSLNQRAMCALIFCLVLQLMVAKQFNQQFLARRGKIAYAEGADGRCHQKKERTKMIRQTSIVKKPSMILIEKSRVTVSIFSAVV